MAKHFIGLGSRRERIRPWPKIAWLPTRGREFIYICMISTEFLKRDRTAMSDKKTELSVDVSKLPEPYQLIVVTENNQHQKENQLRVRLGFKLNLSILPPCLIEVSYH